MPQYIVEVPEIHISRMLIEADTPDDARRMVSIGDGVEISCKYRKTETDFVEWSISEIKELT
jgi:hypothetical protein